MKTLSNLVNTTITNLTDKTFEEFVNESLENNTPIINEDKLLIDHGKDLDSLLYKVKQYAYNSVHGVVNESYDETITLDEQILARDLFIYVCEEYRRKLLEEYNICNKLLNGDETTVNEKFALGEKIENIWHQGTDAVLKLCKEIKTSIESFNKLIVMFATKAFKSLKEIAERVIEFITALNTDLLSFVNKLGCNKEEVDELSNEVSDDLVANPDKIIKVNVYESYGNFLESYLNEGVVNVYHDTKEKIKTKFDNSKLGKWWNSGKNPKTKALIKGFFQFCNWILVCKFLPGVVMAIFPGSLFALIVPVVVKLIWNIKKLKPIIKQIEDLVHGWKTLKWKDKIILALTLAVSIYCWISNMSGILNDIGPLADALGDSLKKGTFLKDMFGEAHAGIKPDAWSAWIASAIKAIKEGKSITEAHEELLKSFEKTVPNAADLAKSVAEKAQHIAGMTKGASKSIEDEVKNKFTNYTGSSSAGLDKEILKMSTDAGFDNSKIVDTAKYTIYTDGSAFGSKWGGMAKDVVKDWSPFKLFNKTLHGINKNAGAGTLLTVTGAELKELANKGILRGLDGGGDGRFWCIVGEIGSEAPVSPTDIGSVSTFINAFHNDAPIITYSPQNKALRVRLGDRKSKNYIYEIDKNGTKTIKVSELKEGKLKEAYETIAKVMNKANDEFTTKLKSAAKSDEDKKEVDNLDYKNKLDTDNIVTVFYGKWLGEEKSKQYNESLSLYEYLIKEAEEEKTYTLSQVKQNIKDFRNFLWSKGKQVNIESATGNTKDDSYDGHVRVLLMSIFGFKKNNKTTNFEWKQGYTPKTLNLSKRDENKFGPKDLNVVAAFFTKYIYNDLKDNTQPFLDGLADIIMLKKQLDDSDNEITDLIKDLYIRMVDNFKQSSIFANEIKDKEWEPGKEWAPLKFNEDDTNSENTEKIKKAEDEATTAESPDETEKKLKDDGVAIPDKPEGSTEEPKETEEETDKEPDSKEAQPVLMFANVYGIDIADANKEGPRKEIYSLRGAFHSLEFIEFKGGMNNHDVKIMLGDMLYSMVRHLINATTASPIEKKKHWWKDKILVNSAFAANDARKDFGNLTNGDIVDIITNKKNARKYIEMETATVSAAETEDEKKAIQKDKETGQSNIEQKLKNGDEKAEELKNALNEITKDTVDDKGNIDKTKLDKTLDTLSNYRMARHKKKEKKGLWQRIVDAFKKFFTGKDEEKRYKRLNSIVYENLNESIYDGIEYDDNPQYDMFEDYTPRHISLANFIKENLH